MDCLDRYREIVPDYVAFRAIQCQPLDNSARINTLKINREKLLERLEEEGVLFHSFTWYPLGLKLDIESPGKLLENLLGYIHIQEELSMVPPLVLGPEPGESVLDLCASPGSKTTQISQMMKNRGLVIANEPSLARVAPLRSNCERLGDGVERAFRHLARKIHGDLAGEGDVFRAALAGHVGQANVKMFRDLLLNDFDVDGKTAFFVQDFTQQAFDDFDGEFLAGKRGVHATRMSAPSSRRTLVRMRLARKFMISSDSVTPMICAFF